MVEDRVQQLTLSSAERVPLKNWVQLRTLEELRILEEQVQREELAVRALRILAVRALLRNLALRALKVKHLACAQASLPWISSA